jgi:MOB kinase activator 1
MTWVQNLLDDENTFPTKSGNFALSPSLPVSASHVTRSCTLHLTGQDFPASFPSTIKHVYRQLLRVFAHIYHAHYPQILHLRSEPHFNSLFAHFLAFGREYELLDVKDVRGTSNSPAVGIGALWERWREMGILES